MVNRVYDEANFERNVGIIARELADGPTHLQGMAKAGFHMGWRRSIEEATEFEIQNVMKTVRHPHFQKTLDEVLCPASKRATRRRSRCPISRSDPRGEAGS